MMAGQFLGDISPTQTWQALQNDVDAVLIDVRTRAEWTYVGGPDLSGLNKTVGQVEWLTFPAMKQNPRFLQDFRALRITPQQTVYLICRSGVRSRHAAELLAKHGYTTWNVADGFEGQIDGNSHRGVGGWRAEGLPWKQS
jgi:rhodanese-related sulfurtransferase